MRHEPGSSLPERNRIEKDTFKYAMSGTRISGPVQDIRSEMKQNSRRGREAISRFDLETLRVPEKISPSFLSVSFATALLFSGVAALVYQVLWIRQLSLVVGVEIYSITVAVSAFFAGLAFGSAAFGHRADSVRHPLRLYAALEAATALTAVLATILLSHSATAFVVLETHAGWLAWSLPFLLVGMPAFFMGGTLPVAIRAQSPARVSIAQAAGWIYAVNTGGAIAGALLSSFLLIPALGVRGTALAAAFLNLVAAIIAWTIDRNYAQAEIIPAAKPSKPATTPQMRLIFVLYGAAGGLALGYEIVWSQAMAQFLSTRVFAFSIMLATYLTGLAIGSALYARFAGRVRDNWGIFGLLIAAAGVIALLEITVLSLWQLQVQLYAGAFAFTATHSEFARMSAQFLIASLGIVFLPTVFLGAAFPAALNLCSNGDRAGKDAGQLLALNTMGGIAGTLLTGFFMIPTVGVVHTLAMLAIGAAVIGAVAVLLGVGVGRRMQWLVCLLFVGAIVAGIYTPADRLARLLLTTRGGGELIFYQESRGATVAVAEQRTNNNIFRRLYIQGVSNSGDAMPSMRYMRLQAMLPLIIHRGEPQSALVIGFGTGITAGAVLHYPNLKRRVCIELLPAVVKAGSLFPENYKAASDPGLQIDIADGRQHLLRNAQRYDLITLEPPPPSAEGVVNLYSTEFYRLASRRLQVNGLFAQWLPIATQNDRDTRSLVRSFLDVFPYATLWTTELHEMLLVGSLQPIELNAADITDRYSQADVSTSLQAVGISSPAALLATWVTGREGLERYAGTARPVTDNDPRIEYSSWVHPSEITHVLPEMLALQTPPPVADADDAFTTQVSHEHQTLMKFYNAGLAAYDGNRYAWTAAMQYVMAQDSGNPYYGWLSGRSQ